MHALTCALCRLKDLNGVVQTIVLAEMGAAPQPGLKAKESVFPAVARPGARKLKA